MRHTRGFSMVELVMVMVMIGVLAAVAVPRMSTSEYHTRAFLDKTLSALRYAQKTAVSHRRMVCVTFNGSGSMVNLSISLTRLSPACSTALPLADGSASVLSGDAANAVFSPVPANIYFQSDGRATSDAAGATPFPLTTLTVAGLTIQFDGVTGHVQ